MLKWFRVFDLFGKKELKREDCLLARVTVDYSCVHSALMPIVLPEMKRAIKNYKEAGYKVTPLGAGFAVEVPMSRKDFGSSKGLKEKMFFEGAGKIGLKVSFEDLGALPPDMELT